MCSALYSTTYTHTRPRNTLLGLFTHSNIWPNEYLIKTDHFISRKTILPYWFSLYPPLAFSSSCFKVIHNSLVAEIWDELEELSFLPLSLLFISYLFFFYFFVGFSASTQLYPSPPPKRSIYCFRKVSAGKRFTRSCIKYCSLICSKFVLLSPDAKLARTQNTEYHRGSA